MYGRFALLLLAWLGVACNDGEAGETSLETCSAENVVDDTDDGIEAVATGAQAASADLSQ